MEPLLHMGAITSLPQEEWRTTQRTGVMCPPSQGAIRLFYLQRGLQGEAARQRKATTEIFHARG